MHVSLWNVALQAINFVLLAWLLQRFLFKPVRAAIAGRQEAVTAALCDAGRTEEEAKRAVEEYRLKAAEVAEEAAKARAQGLASAQAEAERIRAEAARVARAELERSKAEAGRERADALRALEERAIELAATLTERMLRETLSESDAPFLWRMTEAMEAQDAARKSAMIRELGATSVELASARPLDAATRGRFEAWLTALVRAPVRVTYTEDVALIAGVELRSPTGVWRASWRAAIDGARAAMESHERAA